MPVEYTCLHCGATIIGRPGNHRKYCSLSCHGKSVSGSLIERFWAHVDVRGSDECWPWTGSISAQGYGRVSHGGKSLLAHRIALEIALGRPLSEGMYACHHCDNRPCSNPKHLFEGTHLDNMRDAAAKGRMATGDRLGYVTHPESTPRGEHHYRAKLTEDDIRLIRALALTGKTQEAIARQFNVGRTNISMIVARKKWQHVA